MNIPFTNNFKIIIILLVFNLTPTILISQTLSDDLIAEIGPKLILKEEFENRLNFVPKEGIQDKNNNQGIKSELLYTMIGEKLWVNYALESGYEAKQSVITAKNVIQKMFVRDELYRIEIKDRITISDEEYDSAAKRYDKILNVTVWHHESVDSLKKVINNNRLTDSQNISLSVSKYGITEKSLNISFGDLPETIENNIYNLNMGEISQPMKMDSGWSRFFVKNIEDRKYDNIKMRMESDKSIKKIITRRKEENRYDDFHKTFFKGKEIDADGRLFKVAAENLSKIFKDKVEAGFFGQNKEGENVISLDSEDLRLLERIIDEKILVKPFLKFNSEPINLITFLREISFLSFSVSDHSYRNVKIELNKKLKEYIKHELLAREGIKRGLDKSSSVQKWVNVWYDNFLYQAVRNDQLKIVNMPEADNIKQKKELLTREKYADFIEKTISLSEKYRIFINGELFNKVNQGNINLFVYRNLGFGGTIAGVPSSPVFIDWYLEKQKRNIQNL